MSWLALLLIGIGITDLLRSARPIPAVPEAIGGGAVIAVALLAGLTHPRDIVAMVVILGVVVAWGVTVRGNTRPWVPLVVFAVAVAGAVVTAPLAGAAGGAVGDWLDATPWGLVAGLPADRALLILGGLLIQCSTGNVVVRLVLTVTGTVNPIPGHDARTTLKGGRMLGPMERLVLFGLGLAGQLTAASVVIAAKGLIRWPELRSLQSKPGDPSINEVTEYFLVGSFVSWLVSLSTLVLVST